MSFEQKKRKIELSPLIFRLLTTLSGDKDSYSSVKISLRIYVRMTIKENSMFTWVITQTRPLKRQKRGSTSAPNSIQDLFKWHASRKILDIQLCWLLHTLALIKTFEEILLSDNLANQFRFFTVTRWYLRLKTPHKLLQHLTTTGHTSLWA